MKNEEKKVVITGRKALLFVGILLPIILFVLAFIDIVIYGTTVREALSEYGFLSPAIFLPLIMYFLLEYLDPSKK